MDAPIASPPRIYLVARPCLHADGLEQFFKDEATVWHRTQGASEVEQIVELGGRLCYMSFGESQSPRTTAEYVDNLIAMGHESVLEHAVWSFIITGISRAFSHQLVRHRVGFSFSQLSQQYHDERGANFVLPQIVRENPKAREVWVAVLLHSKEAYGEILTKLEAEPPKNGREISPKELRRALRSAARSVLPNATETKIFITANARAIRHFLFLRGAIVGDPEMRAVSVELLKVVKAEAPSIFSDFEICVLPDNSLSVVLKTK